jgi:hypothetical protein
MKKFVRLFGFLIFSVFFTTASNATYTQDQVDAIVNHKVKEMFDLINENWGYMYPVKINPDEKNADFYTNASSEFWTTACTESRLSPKLIDSNCNMIEALRNLPTKKALLECAIVSNLVKILCLLELMCEENFNKYLFTLQKRANMDRIDGKFFQTMAEQFQIMTTDFGFTFIKNCKFYSDVKPFGCALGFNGYLFPDHTFLFLIQFILKKQNPLKVSNTIFSMNSCLHNM